MKTAIFYVYVLTYSVMSILVIRCRSPTLQSEFYLTKFRLELNMKTIYLVWKDRNCEGIDPEWIYLNRNEFNTFINLPENNNRRFIKLSSTNNDDADCRIVIEATDVQYKDWLVEKSRNQYIRNRNSKFNVVSYHAFNDDDDVDFYYEDLLEDTEFDTENECLKIYEIEKLKNALNHLSEEELRMITYLFLSDDNGTERGYAEISGITKSSVNRKKIIVLEKIKKYLSN